MPSASPGTPGAFIERPTPIPRAPLAPEIDVLVDLTTASVVRTLTPLTYALANDHSGVWISTNGAVELQRFDGSIVHRFGDATVAASSIQESDDRSVSFYRSNSSAFVQRVGQPARALPSALLYALSPDGRNVAVVTSISRSPGRELSIVSTDTGQTTRIGDVRPCQCDGADPTPRWSSSGRYLLSTLRVPDGKLAYDIATGSDIPLPAPEPVASSPGRPPDKFGRQPSNDGGLVASIEGRVSCDRFSGAPELVARSGASDAVIRRVPLPTFDGAAPNLHVLVWSPDSRYVLVQHPGLIDIGRLPCWRPIRFGSADLCVKRGGS